MAHIMEPEAPADMWRRFHDNLGLICILLMVYLLFNTICLVLFGFRRYELSADLGKNSPPRLLNQSLRSLASTDILTTTIAFTYFWSDRRWNPVVYWAMEDACLFLQTTNDAVIVCLTLFSLSSQAEEGTENIELQRSSHLLRWRSLVLEWGVWAWAFLCSLPNISVLIAPQPSQSLGRSVAYWRDVFLSLFIYFLVLACVYFHFHRSSKLKSGKSNSYGYLPILILAFLITRFPAFSLGLFFFRAPIPHYSDNASAGFLFTEYAVIQYWIKIAIHFVVNLAYTELIICCDCQRAVASMRGFLDGKDNQEKKTLQVNLPSSSKSYHSLQ